MSGKGQDSYRHRRTSMIRDLSREQIKKRRFWEKGGIKEGYRNVLIKRNHLFFYPRNKIIKEIDLGHTIALLIF